MSDITKAVFQKQLTRDTVDTQFCSDWLKEQITGLFARITEATAERDLAQRHYLMEVNGRVGRADEQNVLRTQLAIATEALELYADPFSWRTRSGKIGITPLTDGRDCEMIDGQFAGGKAAREALAKLNQSAPDTTPPLKVTAQGIHFGMAYISHDAILSGRGPIVKARYQEWLNKALTEKVCTNTPKVQAAALEVLDELSKLSPEEFRKAIDETAKAIALPTDCLDCAGFRCRACNGTGHVGSGRADG